AGRAVGTRVHDRFRAELAGPPQRRGGDVDGQHARAPGRADHHRGQPPPAPPRPPLTTPAPPPPPPRPRAPSQSLGRTRPCAVTARNAVANRQPRQAAGVKPTSGGSATRIASAAGTATNSANDPGPVKPGWVCRGHTWALPARQC